MTKRERFLKALRNEPVDELVWAPNFDYWLAINQAEETLPPEYVGMSRNDIVRSIGGCIWNRTTGYRSFFDSSVHEAWRDEDDRLIHEIDTPKGSIREVYIRTEGEHRSRFLAEHFVKDLDSLAVMKYIVEATHYEADYAPTIQALEETGDDGVVLNTQFCLPFIQFAKTDAGYQTAFFMWMDHKAEVDALIDAYTNLYLEGCRILADGPCDVIAANDNMDGTMISPAVFREYGIPFYQKAKEICAAKGKIWQGHWCGRTQTLLPLVPECGLDVVEAIVTEPMADITLAKALDLLDGKVVLQGGVPAVLVCEEGGTAADFERYIQEIILPLRGRRGFILGMADNVPPNADFSRVKAIAELIAK